LVVTTDTAREPDFEPDEESLGDEAGHGRIRQLVAQELGAEWAERFSAAWQRLDDWDARHNVSEGLRERKKRLTRQRISDVATAMFVGRGYDNVRISEIAEKVGVSEKTIYNYFPTKESLVFDDADRQLRRLAAAVRDRPAGSSPTAAVVGCLKEDMARLAAALGDGTIDFLPAFGRMMRETPALRAAWGEHRHAMVQTLTAILAEEAGIDPRDPEPISTARALVSLLELMLDSQMRHVGETTTAAELLPVVTADLDRAARLLDTGLWSFHLMVEGRKTKAQLRDAAVAAEQARQQVMSALRDARSAFQRAHREIHQMKRVAAQEKRQQAREAARLRGRGRG
jgi:AcrR family transcriptional regulator